MVLILNQISNQLHNTSDPVLDSSEDGSNVLVEIRVVVLSLSLVMVSSTIALALHLKYMLWRLSSSSGTYHNPEEQARSRELLAQRLRSRRIPSRFDVLTLFMVLSETCFSIGCVLMIMELSPFVVLVFLVFQLGTVILFRNPSVDSLPAQQSRPPNGKAVRRGRGIINASSRKADLDPKIVDVGIPNFLFIHTSMVPTNFSIFIQLFALPVEHSRRRITRVPSAMEPTIFDPTFHALEDIFTVQTQSFTSTSSMPCGLQSKPVSTAEGELIKKRGERTAPSRPPIHYRICTYTCSSHDSMLLPKTQTMHWPEGRVSNLKVFGV